MPVRPICVACAAIAALMCIGVVVKAGAPRSASSSPRTALSIEQLVSDWYQREFGVSVPRPAIFNDSRAVDCRGDGHLTTTAYLKKSGTAADLLVLYLTRDGLNLIRFRRGWSRLSREPVQHLPLTCGL